MTNYMIHTCKKREWYVKDHLIPSMLSQHIKEEQIKIWLDKKNEGCLQSCMKSFKSFKNLKEGTWHLQDDVLISSDFKAKTDYYNYGVVCGFCSEYSRERPAGYVDAKYMWYSFPCIRIPNRIAKLCSQWFFKEIVTDPDCKAVVNSKKWDDTIFDIFLTEHLDEGVLNLRPNIVEHIDFLIGGSVVNKDRIDHTRAMSLYFDEKELVKKLKEDLTNADK